MQVIDGGLKISALAERQDLSGLAAKAGGWPEAKGRTKLGSCWGCDTYGLLSLGLGHHVVGLRHLHSLGRHFDVVLVNKSREKMEMFCLEELERQ